MKQEIKQNIYKEWIRRQNFQINTCLYATMIMTNTFPDLTRVKGTVLDKNEKSHIHWWCKDSDDNIFDPTNWQFQGPLTYIEYRTPELI